MTDIEYLQTLDAIERDGDAWGKTATSPKYGITEAGLERITRNIRMEDGNGNYTKDALDLQNKLSPKLRKILLDNLEWKDGKLTKHASLEQVSKAGKDVWGELALATRYINKRKLGMIGGQPLEEDVQERVCLAAHQIPALLNDKKIQEAIRSNNTEALRHEMLTNMDHVDDDVLLGTKRRRAALFNPEWKATPILTAWEELGKGGRAGITQSVNNVYKKDEEVTYNRLREISHMQAFDSQYDPQIKNNIQQAKKFPNEDLFMAQLFPNKATKYAPMQKQSIAEAKPIQNEAAEPSALERFANSLKPFLEPLLGGKDKVANQPQNILNNTKGDVQ